MLSHSPGLRLVPALFLIASVAAQSDDWRAFRGTDGTAASDGSAPLRWSDTENLRWKTELPGPGTSSPIVVGDHVYVTCWSGYGLDREAPGDLANLRRHLLCVDRRSGEVRWQKTVQPVPTEDSFDGRLATHGYASSTPVADDDHVFVFFGKAGVFAFDHEGESVWHADVGSGSSEWKTGSGSSPSLWGDLLFVNAADESHSLRALYKHTGAEVWQRASPAFDQAYGTPIVAAGPDRPVLLYGLLGAVWGLDPHTGKEVWRVATTTDGALAPSIVLGDGVLFSFGGQTRQRSCAIRLGGAGDVTDSHVVWSSRNGTYVCTPLLVGTRLYYVNEGGIAHCADAGTGELLYKERLDGAFYASPVRVGERIYVVSRNDGTYVLPLGDEFEVLSHNRFEGDDSSFEGTPAASDGCLFLRSRRFLYCVGP